MHVNMSEPTATSRFLSLGEIAERVIDKLHLPLPIISQMPREKEQAELIVEAASRYLVSDEFQIRADKFRDEVIARGKLTNWCEASTRLGVPLWLIIDATHSQAIDGCDKSALGSIMSVVRERLAIRPAIVTNGNYRCRADRRSVISGQKISAERPVRSRR